jgi:hypothetical protein
MPDNLQPRSRPDPDLISPRILPHQAAAAKALRRARSRMMVCFWTLPLYMLAIWVLLTNRRETDVIMFVYMGVWAGFALDMARRRCPLCKKQFYVKHVLMNLRARRCVHCGFDSHSVAEAADRDGVTQ